MSSALWQGPRMWCVAAIVCVLPLTAASARAGDRIVLQAPDKASPLVIPGDIADYTADIIEIHLTVGNPVHRYPADQVVSVQTVQTMAHRAGVRSFQQGELETAREQFQQALSEEPRAWVKREILGWLVKIALRNGQRAEAGRRFLQIIGSESAPREYSVIPLVWGAANIDQNLQQYGRLWLTGNSDVERLLGSSALLLDQRYAETARNELDRLARVADMRVAALARAQLWRLRATSADVTENEMASWQQTISHLPPELRAGPYFVLGRAALHRSEYDRAAAAFMWLPTVYHENESLTAQAAIGAATALKRIGRLDEARLLLEELASDYAWSPAASEAAVLLSELEPKS